MKRFINKVRETNGYKEQKVFFQQKIDAEKARIAHRYNEKQQAAEAAAPHQDAPPQVDANVPADIATQAPQEHPLPTEGARPLAASMDPLPQDIPALHDEIENLLTHTQEVLAAMDFSDMSDSDFEFEAVITVATAPAEPL